MYTKILFSIFLSLSALADSGMSVSEAYAAIPHNRTVFNLIEAKSDGMTDDEIKTANEIFSIIDDAIVLKVSLQKKKQNDIKSSYAQLISRVEKIVGPSRLDRAKNLILGALQDHQLYFLSSDFRQGKSVYSSSFVKSASGKLQNAYSELMATFPKQSTPNKKAFFDYLCALDFI